MPWGSITNARRCSSCVSQMVQAAGHGRARLAGWLARWVIVRHATATTTLYYLSCLIFINISAFPFYNFAIFISSSFFLIFSHSASSLSTLLPLSILPSAVFSFIILFLVFSHCCLYACLLFLYLLLSILSLSFSFLWYFITETPGEEGGMPHNPPKR